jgi:hypothetical protein
LSHFHPGNFNFPVCLLHKLPLKNKQKIYRSSQCLFNFSISNLGMFGSVSSFTAIINPPQAAILAVGGLVETLSNSGEPTSQFGATLCYDARAIDDRSAQRFMQALQTGLTEPAALLAGMEAEAVDFLAGEDEDQLLMDLETLELQEDGKAREANVVATAAAAGLLGALIFWSFIFCDF